MYIFLMRKLFEPKIMSVQRTVSDVRETSRRIGEAAESQVTLNIALTAVSVTALMIALVVLQDLWERQD